MAKRRSEGGTSQEYWTTMANELFTDGSSTTTNYGTRKTMLEKTLSCTRVRSLINQGRLCYGMMSNLLVESPCF